jgi:hypothetical protein
VFQLQQIRAQILPVLIKHFSAAFNSIYLRSNKVDPSSDLSTMENLPHVTRFCYSKMSQRLEASHENSIVLIDSAGLGRNELKSF